MKTEKFKKVCSGGGIFTVCIMIGVFSGIVLGLVLRQLHYPWSERHVIYLLFLGDLFLRALRSLILPLIVCSLVDAVGSLDFSISKKIGTRALVYFSSTTAIAAIFGIFLGVIVKPGFNANFVSGAKCDSSNASTTDTMLDLVRNIFPPNLVAATLEGVSFTVKPDLEDSGTKTIVGTNAKGEEAVSVQTVAGINMLGLVAFSMILGVALGRMGNKGKPLLDFFAAFGHATMMITSKVVLLAPVAICFLIAGQLVAQDDITSIFRNIGWYFGTVTAGLLIHGFLILPTIYTIITKKLPFKFAGNMFEALATAFGTASSSATLPVTMKCLEENNKIDVRVTKFVAPIGATVNMNGTALYLSVAPIYIAQLCGQTLSIGQLTTICLVSITTSIGAAGIPQFGIVVLITVLGSIGLPISHIAYILPIDWVLERFRTALNIWGDSIGAGIVAHLSQKDLVKMDLISA